MRWRVFGFWCIGLGAFWVFANWPIRFGKANMFGMAGFPLRFASWFGEKLDYFDAWALTIDLILGGIVVLGLSWLCRWSRLRWIAKKRGISKS